MTKEEYYNQDIPLEKGIKVSAVNNRISISILHQTFYIEPNWDTEEEMKWHVIQIKKALTQLKFKE